MMNKNIKELLYNSNQIPLNILILVFCLGACTDFVEVELPKNQLSTESVFEDPATTEAALKSIYGKMRTNGLLSGNGLNTMMGAYADELDYYGIGQSQLEYYHSFLIESNTIVAGWWSNAYNQIYAANLVIEGVENSTALKTGDKDRFKGEALFIRAYLHFLLTELFGDIPYITNTNYLENTNIARISRAEVYEKIITDLDLAISLLPVMTINISEENYDRTRPYVAVAEAMLARAYLYSEDWTMAEVMTDKVITKFGALEPDLDKVFLKNASGTIWQFKPNIPGENSSEGRTLIFSFSPPTVWALSDVLYNAFETNDLRQSHWIKAVPNFSNTETWYHVFKYKERNTTFLSDGETPNSVEYSIQFRLAEQYLIRAEARAHNGNIAGSQADINTVRNRAGLDNTTATTVNELLDAILQERRVELFTEQGHRWFDLKRMGKATDVLAPIKIAWKPTAVLLPIPGAEISINPNLLPQNNGYQ